MIKKLLSAFLLVTSFSYAQYTVKGELERFQNYPWMILYELQGGEQNYIAYDSIIKGQFSIPIPKNQAPGMYRLVYDVKNQASVDFIFDNENVELIFNPKEASRTIRFPESENNKIYQNYLKVTQKLYDELDSLQVRHFSFKEGQLDKQYTLKRQQLESIQKEFEVSSNGKISAAIYKSKYQALRERTCKISWGIFKIYKRSLFRSY